MEYLLFAVASLFGSLLAWRALRESCALLILAEGPLLGAAALVALSNAKVAPVQSFMGLIAASAVLAGWPHRAAAEESDAPHALARPRSRRWPVWLPMGRASRTVLALAALVVTVYTIYHQVHVLDGDRWLHDAQIVAFQRGIYPPVNPLFPDLAMNGHFGRDLLMATLLPDGVDPAYTTWWVTPILQLASFLTLFASTRSFTGGSNLRGLLVSSLIFFGMDCGFRVGMLDTFDGSNGLAYPHLVLLFHLMNRILAGAEWPVWLISGVVLGTYQLVYMTSFALLLVAGFAAFLAKARTRQAWVGLLVTGILAVGLALTEGGAFTDMAHRGLKPELNKAVQNQGLRVTVQFPKEHFMQVLTSTAGYHRTSVAYHTPLFRGLYAPPRGEGYLSIWDPQFMRTHWLPLYLAPVALWFVRRSPLGLSFWLFGAISYVLPGLFYFGPIFEAEYYRWELSAAFGFAGALGIALGEWMDGRPIRVERSPFRLTLGRGSLGYLVGWAVLLACLAAGEQEVNSGLIAMGKPGYEWFPNLRQWRLAEPTFGLTRDTLAACDWLRQRTRPGQQVLTNFLNDRPGGLWPDVVSATLAGVFPAGHGYPSETEGGPHGNPAFHQNSVYRAFWATADLSLLEQTHLRGWVPDSRGEPRGGSPPSAVRWLLADTSRLSKPVLDRLQGYPHQMFGDRLAVELPEHPPGRPSDWSLTDGPHAPENADLRLGERYPLRVTFDNPGDESRSVLTVGDGLLVEPLRFTVPKGGGECELSLCTPLDEGTYHAVLTDLDGKEKAAFDFTVDFLQRLSELKCQIAFPQLKVGRFYTLEGKWESAAPLHSQGELEVAYRFRRPDGDYAWEVDSIPQPIDLRLPENPAVRLQVLTPSQPGPYQLELWFFYKGRRLQLKQSYAVNVDS